MPTLHSVSLHIGAHSLPETPNVNPSRHSSQRPSALHNLQPVPGHFAHLYNARNRSMFWSRMHSAKMDLKKR
jgi:hypothetical protein